MPQSEFSNPALPSPSSSLYWALNQPGLSEPFRPINTNYINRIHEMKGMVELREKHGDGEKVPEGGEGRKRTLGTQTKRKHSKVGHRNQETDSENKTEIICLQDNFSF